ncbi:hypothetical protein M885DRAFT_537047 [Pelagophyceae sp. CCMP2097]|nr:hypothetical protein M885DRAFT_537047 [Pelagophyceae sp. CCMP2097]|mmetsp:Transcript_3302/g.9997  ORF Transcript_3302/g.9997 Transcript_3302/m.9997 type:complete len:245 (+) Transcript_3302:15-749(+)
MILRRRSWASAASRVSRRVFAKQPLVGFECPRALHRGEAPSSSRLASSGALDHSSDLLVHVHNTLRVRLAEAAQFVLLQTAVEEADVHVEDGLQVNRVVPLEKGRRRRLRWRGRPRRGSELGPRSSEEIKVRPRLAHLRFQRGEAVVEPRRQAEDARGVGVGGDVSEDLCAPLALVHVRGAEEGCVAVDEYARRGAGLAAFQDRGIHADAASGEALERRERVSAERRAAAAPADLDGDRRSKGP